MLSAAGRARAPTRSREAAQNEHRMYRGAGAMPTSAGEYDEDITRGLSSEKLS